MEPANTLYSSILLLGAAHGLFLSLALINVKGGNALAHRLLALLTLTFAADLGVDFLYESRYLLLFPKLTYVEEVLSFLYGPLAYLYVMALTARDGFRFSGRKWLHFLPFALSIVLLIPFYLQSDSQVVAQIYHDADIDSVGLWVIGALLVLIVPIPQIGIYLVFAVRRLIRHSRNIRDEFSAIERISLVWLRNLLIALGVLYLIYVFALLFSDHFGIGKETEGVMNLLIVAVIYTMGYMGLRQPDIFTKNADDIVATADTAEQTIVESDEPERKKYQKSALDSDMSRALLQELTHFMAVDRPYLDSALTLTELAAKMKISSNYLSQIINEQTGSNFFDYINQHRVEEAKALLADPAHARTGILTLAMEAGFNSKSAFYTAFKQHTGVTPSQFRKLPSIGRVPS